ncbi:MAG: BTAD domain-containing putative transcriptional regulator [bacterium]|nr:BTAD domain-containing putative transcriptional regulator [bacterium]
MARPPIIAITNITPPQFGQKTVRRERIIRLLNENFDKRLILVCAGAGYGKTTVLSEFVALSKTPVAWYHVESSHSSLLPFVLHLAQAIQKARPQFGAQIPQLMDFIQSCHTQYEAVFATLVNELAENVFGHLSVVLDNLDVVGHDETLMKAIDYFIWHLPPNVTLIICARCLPALSLSRLEAQNAVLIIGEKELGFTREEIALLFQEVFGRSLAQRELDKLSRHIEGWVSGLIIYGKLGMQKNADWDHETLFTYFSEEIFEKQDRIVQEFLLGSSALDPISVEICDAIFHRNDSQKQLILLESSHLFTARQDEQAEWFRYHPLFRDFLRKKARSVGWYPWKESYCRIGEFFEAKQDFQVSIPIYITAGEYGKAAQLIESLGLDSLLITNGRVWINHLPGDTLDQHPRLYCLRAEIALTFRECDSALSDLHTAMELYEASGDKAGLAEAQRLVGTAYFWLGKWEDAIRALKQSLEGHLDANGRFLAIGYLGDCQGLAGHRESAVAAFREARAIAQKMEDKPREFLVSVKLEELTGKSGDVADYSVEEFGTVLGKARYYEFTGVRCWKMGDYVKALDALDSFQRLLQTYRLPELQDVELDQGLVALYQLRYPEARQHFQRAAVLAEQYKDCVSLEWSRAMLIETAFYAGRTREAKALLRQYLPNMRDEQTRLTSDFVRARIALSERQMSLAKGLFADIARMCAKFMHYPFRIMVHLVQAQFALVESRNAEAKTHLRKAVQIAQRQGFHGVMLREYLWDPDLFESAGQDGICREYIEFLESKTLENRVVIEAKCLGPLRFAVAGEEIAHDSWKSGRSRAILAYLAFYPKHKHTRGKLIELFWEDIESSVAEKNFHPTLSYIKSALNSNTQDRSRKIESVVHRGGLYFLNPELHFETDIAYFQRLIEEARRCETDNVPQAIADYEAAIELYRGDFLEEFNYRWAEERRVYYRSRLYEVLKAVATLHASTGDWPKALEHLTRARLMDELDEDVHIEIIRCYLQLGMKKAALNHFREMEQLLQEKLGAKPSQTVKALFHAPFSRTSASDRN